ncbi:uncharacterized protein [Palaemon carinicauda]|uniref:uncharacterized protein isoform X2 n=1 Tax=Palaemon carinicauda TaxID=392227 RepID=UPI0035B635FD
MVELIIERQPQESQVYFKERGGICRILQLGCLASVEGCLGFELYEEPGKVLVQVILAIIPLVTIICLLAAHILFGPHEFWPTLQRFSWHKLEGIHDFTAFMLLLPSAVTLFIPPCTKFETSAGVLTLVALFLVTLQGIENLCRT